MIVVSSARCKHRLHGSFDFGLRNLDCGFPFLSIPNPQSEIRIRQRPGAFRQVIALGETALGEIALGEIAPGETALGETVVD